MRLRIQRDERGASLALAIVFMVVVGAVGGGVVASIGSGVGNGVHLAQARNRQYAADAAIENSIARVRRLNAGGVPVTGFPSCGSDPTYTFETDPSVNIHVDCTNVPTPAGTGAGAVALQNDVVFKSCLNADVAAGKCPDDKSIVNAQVNFQTNGPLGGPFTVTTYVLSWSVNA
jgi:hypothetical protein